MVKSSGKNRFRIHLIVIMMLLVFTGCSNVLVYIPLDAARYQSSISKSGFSEYDGTQIYLEYIDNKADNTSIFYYFSPDGKIQYGEAALTSYFWYCYRDALEAIGMRVYEESPPQGVPYLNLTFFSLTDCEFKFTIVLHNNGSSQLKKQYIVKMEKPTTRNKAILEQKAYQLIDLTLKTILSDEEFQRAFLKDPKGDLALRMK